MIVNRYKLNTIPDRVLPLVMVSQYDSARQIEFELYNGEEEYSPTSAQILIGTNQYEGTISNNIVSFTVPSELTQESQYLFGEIVCFESGRMGTCNFRFKVDFTPIEEDSSASLTLNTLTINKPNLGLKPTLLTPMPIDEEDEPIEEEPIEDEEPVEEEQEETEEPVEETEEEAEEPIEETEETEEEVEEETEEGN